MSVVLLFRALTTRQKASLLSLVVSALNNNRKLYSGEPSPTTRSTLLSTNVQVDRTNVQKLRTQIAPMCLTHTQIRLASVFHKSTQWDHKALWLARSCDISSAVEPLQFRLLFRIALTTRQKASGYPLPGSTGRLHQ